MFSSCPDQNGNYESISNGASGSGGSFSVSANPGENNELLIVNDTNSYGAIAIASALQNGNTSSISGDGWALYSNPANTTCSQNNINNSTILTGASVTSSSTNSNVSGIMINVTTSCTF